MQGQEEGNKYSNQPRALMTTNIIQIYTVSENSTMIGKEVRVIEKDCEDYAEY